MAQPSSISKRISISLLALGVYLLLFSLLVFLLNRGVPNYLLTPLPQYLSLFSVIWDDNPMAAIQFILSKSFLVIAHKDPRSGLNLWTVELNFISTAIMVIACWLFSGSLLRYLRNRITRNRRQSFVLTSIASALICMSVSYMTVIEHCAGPTWIGFVSLYGLGFEGFDLHPVYQIALGLFACVILGLAVHTDKFVFESWLLFKRKPLIANKK